jgi:competence protein ComEC
MTQRAGLKKIDYLVISHFHADHAGGLAALSKMIPIGRFFDRGDVVEIENKRWLDAYHVASAGKRTIVKPGDTIPIKGLRVVVVSSNQEVIAEPVNGAAPNPLCGVPNRSSQPTLKTPAASVFKYLNLIDLDWRKGMELACPLNKLGKVTLYTTGRHGSFDGAGAPAFLGAIQPQVVVVNNGPRKGMGQIDETAQSDSPPGKTVATYERNACLPLAKLPGIEGIWQEHLSLLDPDPKHNTSPDMIANLEETAQCKGNWIRASVDPEGKFTVTNSRNGFKKSYVAR